MAVGVKFNDFSVEIKTLIVQHVTRPTDLVKLCLVSRNLHEITVRQLYQQITLDVGSANDNKLAAFLSPKNIGLPWIRKLDLYMADVPDKCNQEKQAHFAIRMLLELLPENILEKFSWHPWAPFSGDNLVLLYKKQKRMKWLEGIAMDKNVLGELEKLPSFKETFQHVKKLGLYPDNREVLEYCKLLVQNSPGELEKITLHASFDDSDDSPGGIPSRELNDSATGAGVLTNTVFGHLQPFSKCTPLSLREITLQKLNLRYAKKTYCKFIDFRNIKSLRVFGCPGADALLAELTKSTRLPEKLEVLEFRHDDNAENDALNAMDGFLCLVSGIKILTLDINYAKALPAAAGISRHGKTLKELNVHASTPDDTEVEHVYGFSDWQQITKDCSQLEQISAAFPATSVIRHTTDQFVAFEECLDSLPNLVTLNITTWPSNSPSTTKLPLAIYTSLLQSLAETTFRRSSTTASSQQRSSRLNVIAFGSSDKVYDREDSTNQIIFVKGKSIDPLGKERPVAVPIGWCLRKYVESRSDVLDFSLSRSTPPPASRDALRDSSADDSD